MSVLTAGVLREAIRKMPKDPFEEFANKHGFSLLAGDKLLLSKSVKEQIGEHPGIIYSRFVDNAAYLIKPRVLGIMPIPDIKID